MQGHVEKDIVHAHLSFNADEYNMLRRVLQNTTSPRTAMITKDEQEFCLAVAKALGMSGVSIPERQHQAGARLNV